MARSTKPTASAPPSSSHPAAENPRRARREAPHPCFFQHINGELCCESVPLSSLARDFGTPLYVYSLAQVLANYSRLANAFAPAKPLIAYSVKANGNLAIMNALARRGAGFDIVSVGELERVLKAGGEAKNVIFAGVGKRRDEIRRAIQAGVGEFNIESPGEAEAINEEARALDRVAAVAIRLNPDVDAHTHEYITTGRKENKFGINLEHARGVAERILALPNLRLAGVQAHIGSQILDPSVHARAMARLEEFVLWLMGGGVELETLNMGGGFGIDYENGQYPLVVEKVAAQVMPVARRLRLKLVLEPGRYIVGSAGVLLARVLYVKRGSVKTFVIVDASMTDLLRPALYAAHHRVLAVVNRAAKTKAGAGKSAAARPAMQTVDIVGPICESSDFFARERPLPPTEPGDLLAIMDAGAYGFVMSSNYNTRPRPAEVLVNGRKTFLARRRETVEELISLDTIPDASWLRAAPAAKNAAAAKKTTSRSKRGAKRRNS